jgi:hypothetical protein
MLGREQNRIIGGDAIRRKIEYRPSCALSMPVSL